MEEFLDYARQIQSCNISNLYWEEFLEIGNWKVKVLQSENYVWKEKKGCFNIHCELKFYQAPCRELNVLQATRLKIESEIWLELKFLPSEICISIQSNPTFPREGCEMRTLAWAPSSILEPKETCTKNLVAGKRPWIIAFLQRMRIRLWNEQL